VRTAAKRRSARGGARILPGAAERLVSFIRLFDGSRALATRLCYAGTTSSEKTGIAFEGTSMGTKRRAGKR
jgi:hypothetical protein